MARILQVVFPDDRIIRVVLRPLFRTTVQRCVEVDCIINNFMSYQQKN